MGNHIRTYYQILGVPRNEQDPGVIEAAALRRVCLLRRYQLAREVECTSRLNEIALALCTLLDPSRRREYDHSLSDGARPPPGEGPPAARPGPRGPLDGEVEACDVKLVYQGSILRLAACQSDGAGP
jgi:hypothetical protein